MSEEGASVLITLVAVLVLVAAYMIGYANGQHSIAANCDDFMQFKYNEDVYTCAKRNMPQRETP